LQKLDEFVCIKGLINYQPAQLALMGHCGNHGEILACTATGLGSERAFDGFGGCNAPALKISVYAKDHIRINSN
jgi:hypothetical protein